MLPHAAALADLPLLAGLEPAAAMRLAPAFRPLVLDRGERLEPDGRTAILLDGPVRLLRALPDGRWLGLGMLEDGSLFGTLPFCERDESEQAEALASARGLSIAAADVERIAMHYPRVAANAAALVRRAHGGGQPAPRAARLRERALAPGRGPPGAGRPARPRHAARRARRPAPDARPAGRDGRYDARDADEGRRLAARRGHRRRRPQRDLDRRPATLEDVARGLRQMPGRGAQNATAA